MNGSLIQTEETYFFSSSEELGAINKTATGDKFEVRLDKPVSIPPSAVDVSIECVGANIWYTTPNIAAEYNNNTLYLFYGEIAVPVTIVIPDGLYGADTLNATIRRAISAIDIPGAGGLKFASTSIQISSNPATQRIVITLADNLGMFADPLATNNVADTLGFTSDINATYTGQHFEGDSVAKLNRINSYLLHTDLVNDGISINSSFDSILAEIQLTADPGDLLTYRPYIPYRISGKHLKYGTKDNLTFYLTDELNRPIDTFGENFSFTIVIRYKIYEHATMLQLNTHHV